ncbi:hypothetical protein DFH94DRAFT_82006 [Russula ochroleuca]|uniref:Uncharacterized protein n=1 Tax=Russula ochroleuca TaxID=152965 RepID=A0A9P5MT36_9AGAM|nr:hypothetical protein DFH94DRAFT_82006 [Russula ochroleuca]
MKRGRGEHKTACPKERHRDQHCHRFAVTVTDLTLTRNTDITTQTRRQSLGLGTKPRKAHCILFTFIFAKHHQPRGKTRIAPVPLCPRDPSPGQKPNVLLQYRRCRQRPAYENGVSDAASSRNSIPPFQRFKFQPPRSPLSWQQIQLRRQISEIPLPSPCGAIAGSPTPPDGLHATNCLSK